MKILLLGSGAREHALAWKIKISPKCDMLWCAPGNAGTAEIGTNIALDIANPAEVAEFVEKEQINLVVVGPELPLAAGVADTLSALPADSRPLVFGPVKAAALMETSKVYAKKFMRAHGIPTAEFRVFSESDKALSFIESAPWPFVIKASGLASGKGVFLPENTEEAKHIIKNLLDDKALGDAGSEIVIEERLFGEEVSLLGFCDGYTVLPMPLAQDHKRLLEGDCGPNTGGMGAIALGTQDSLRQAQEWAGKFLLPVIAGLQEDSVHYHGVLYAGLILTSQGPKVLEYNCRFGDPETQAILPLLDSDLIELLTACAEGRLAEAKPKWKDEASASVVLASSDYAQDTKAFCDSIIRDFGGTEKNAVIFYAGARREGDVMRAHQGRILCTSGWDVSLSLALEKAYARISRIEIAQGRYRKDIGFNRQFLHNLEKKEEAAASSAAPSSVAYRSAGVDIDAGDRAVALMSAAVKATYTPHVLAGIGAFGGVIDAEAFSAVENPVLVASTDGVGTKVKLAAMRGSYTTIGQDIVNHCIDDILVQGAKPLFFLDYFAASSLKPEMVAQAVSGMAEACKASGCVLIGGETAEMPGVYEKGEFDIAGTIVGVADKGKLLPAGNLKAGDMLIGLPSSGLHTNGFSLARKIFSEQELFDLFADTGELLIDILLKPHRSYLRYLEKILFAAENPIKALAHITGGGFEGNVARILPDSLSAVIDTSRWPIPPVFAAIAEHGNIAAEEMYRVFNMGVGMVAVISPEQFEAVRASIDLDCWNIGHLQPGNGKVIMQYGKAGGR